MPNFFQQWRRRLRYRGEVARHVNDFEGNLPSEIPKQAAPVVVFAAYNEIARLPAFLAWYRNIGVKQFFAIDNGSTDGSGDWLSQQKDVTTMRTTASYAGARHGSIWFNVLLERMKPGQWVIYADADECLMYENMDTVDLPAFTRYLDEVDCQAVFTPLLDLYPAGDISQSHQPDPCDFLSSPNYFHDLSHYVIRLSPSSGRLSHPNLRGGPRMEENNPERSPLLSKWSLFRYEPGRYIKNSHSLFPSDLMADSPKAAMLHFKYSADQLSHLRAVVDEKRHGQYHKDYERYLEQYREGVDLHDEESSHRYDGPEDLKPFLDAIQNARENPERCRSYQRLSALLED